MLENERGTSRMDILKKGRKICELILKGGEKLFLFITISLLPSSSIYRPPPSLCAACEMTAGGLDDQ